MKTMKTFSIFFYKCYHESENLGRAALKHWLTTDSNNNSHPFWSWRSLWLSKYVYLLPSWIKLFCIEAPGTKQSTSYSISTLLIIRLLRGIFNYLLFIFERDRKWEENKDVRDGGFIPESNSKTSFSIIIYY